MHEIHIRVRFCETDALGHINNNSYFIYLEEARIRFFEHLGYNMNASEWSFILASTKCDFLKQGYFNQTLKITTYVSKIGTKSFTLVHEVVCSETGDIIAKGNAIIVYYDFEKQQSATIPEILQEGLSKSLVQL